MSDPNLALLLHEAGMRLLAVEQERDALREALSRVIASGISVHERHNRIAEATALLAELPK